jgi:hypothetical protein
VCIICRKLPMRLGMLLVPLGIPRLDLVDAWGLRRDTAPQTLTTQMAQCDLCHVSPTAVFGGILDCSFIRDSFRLRGIQCFIERCFGVGMQSIHHQTKFFPMRILLIHKLLDTVRPVNFCSLLRDCGYPLSSSRCKSHENVCRAISCIFCVLSERLSRLGWERSPDCTDQLGRHCLSTYLWTLGIIRLLLDISDVLHLADTSGILLRRHTPCFLLPRLKCIFVTVRRMVSCDTASTISHSTMLSASIRKVHRS